MKCSVLYCVLSKNDMYFIHHYCTAHSYLLQLKYDNITERKILYRFPSFSISILVSNFQVILNNINRFSQLHNLFVHQKRAV